MSRPYTGKMSMDAAQWYAHYCYRRKQAFRIGSIDDYVEVTRSATTPSEMFTIHRQESSSLLSFPRGKYAISDNPVLEKSMLGNLWYCSSMRNVQRVKWWQRFVHTRNYFKALSSFCSRVFSHPESAKQICKLVMKKQWQNMHRVDSRPNKSPT